MADTRILLGVIGRPHGVRGLVHVTSYTADPAALAEYGVLSDDSGRRFALEWRADGVAALTLVTPAGRLPVRDRDAAAALVNTPLYIERDRLPAPAEDEFYLADLIGLAAQDVAGQAIGTVAIVHDYGGGVSLEIARPDAAPLILPFSRACVPVVDPAAGYVRVVPPAEIVVAADRQDSAA
jgi:16S rRNA processing protein RimM